MCQYGYKDLVGEEKRLYHVWVLNVSAGEASDLSSGKVGGEWKAGGSDGLEERLGRSQPAGEHGYGVCRLSGYYCSSDGHIQAVNDHSGTGLACRRFLCSRTTYVGATLARDSPLGFTRLSLLEKH